MASLKNNCSYTKSQKMMKEYIDLPVWTNYHWYEKEEHIAIYIDMTKAGG